MRIKDIYGVALLAVCSLSSPILFADGTDAYPVPSIQAPTDIREELVWYSDKNAGVMFAYPKRFTSKPKTDADTLVKLSGVTSAGANGELQLSVAQSDMAVEQFAKLIADALAKQLPSYEQGKMEWVRFGRSLRLNGVTRVASLKIGESKFHQRVTHWSLNGRIYTFTMLGPESQWAALDPVYNYVLLSLAPYGSAGGSAAAPRGEAGNKVAMGYSNWYKKGVGSLAYPSSWQEVQMLEPYVLTKISGTDGSGRGGELQLTGHPAPPGQTLQQFADSVEKQYLQPQKNWSRLTDSTATFGAGTRMEGLSRSGSMTINGAAAMSHTLYFAEGGKFYCLSINTFGYSRADSDSLFQKAIQTLNIDASASSGSAAGSPD